MELSLGIGSGCLVQSYESMEFSEQVPIALNLLQDSAATGDLSMLSWILDRSTIDDFYADEEDELLLMFEMCSAAAVAIQYGHTEVVDELIKRFPKLQQELLLECIVEMNRKSSKKSPSRSIRWLNKKVSSPMMMDLWDLSREYKQEHAMRWFALKRLF